MTPTLYAYLILAAVLLVWRLRHKWVVRRRVRLTRELAQARAVLAEWRAIADRRKDRNGRLSKLADVQAVQLVRLTAELDDAAADRDASRLIAATLLRERDAARVELAAARGKVAELMELIVSEHGQPARLRAVK